SSQVCIFKIVSPTKGWRKILEKLFNTINDLNFTIDKRSKTVYVYGKVDPQKILEKITKAGQKAEIIWSDDKSKKPVENRRNHFMEQEFMNAPPNGFSSHHQQQQISYPPQRNHHHHQQQQWSHPQPNFQQQNQWSYHQPNMMNQFQLPPQSYALPAPYIQQLHPQPAPPPPYTYQPKEPVAKSFPPTPPPPKNFVMGDLQCTIM
ncbi:unnamed protein product, partial [Thlaspi arvense]